MRVDWAGGAASELAQLLAQAHACLDGPRAQRAQRTPAEWESVRRILAAHLPAPDWLSPLDAGERGMRRLLDEQLVAAHRRVVMAADEVRTAWVEATRAVTARRARLDAAFGVARVCLRAWREVTDNVPAGAAKFRQRYDDAERYGHGCRLARRLHFAPWTDGGDTMAYRRTDDDAWNGWRLLMLLLTYQRLVGAGRVRRRRHKSETWRRDDAARRTAMARSAWAPPLPSAAPPLTAVARAPAWPGPAPAPAATPPRRNSGQRKRRSAAEMTAARQAAPSTAGAAAVKARRSGVAATHARVMSCPGDGLHNEVMRLPLARAAHLPTHVEPPRRRRRTAAELEDARARVKRRRHDGQLRMDTDEVQSRLRLWLGDG